LLDRIICHKLNTPSERVKFLTNSSWLRLSSPRSPVFFSLRLLHVY